MDEVVLFSHESNFYAIDASLVEEILEPLPVTLLPSHEDQSIVDGLINIHGKIILQFNFEKILKKYAPPIKPQKKKNKKNSSLRPNNILFVNLDQKKNSKRALYVGEVIGKIKTDISQMQSIEDNAIYKGHFLHKKSIVILLNLAGLNEVAALHSEPPIWDVAFGKPISVGEKNAHFDTPRYLLVKIGDMAYGIDTVDIDELIILSEVTHVPFLPAKVLGLANLRNAPMITVSLTGLIGEEAQEPPGNYGIVVRNKGRSFILSVEEL